MRHLIKIFAADADADAESNQHFGVLLGSPNHVPALSKALGSPVMSNRATCAIKGNNMQMQL